MKNTESAFLLLLAVLFYLRFPNAEDRNARADRIENYLVALLFGTLAMAAKSTTVILPVALALCAWWMGAWNWRRLAGLIPFACASVVFSLMSLWKASRRPPSPPRFST